jgi:cytochrome c-type biogenesis protein CcmF
MRRQAKQIMINTTLGNIGHISIIIAFVSALVATIGYFIATQNYQITNNQRLSTSWKRFARWAFLLHTIALFTVFGTLFLIIHGQYYEYHYAWSHSSRNLPVQYMISCFWEGQEGSFLLWMVWHALLGIVILRTNRFWETSVMTIVMVVQVFLVSMILGVVLWDFKIWDYVFTFKLGSSPFMLMRDAMPDIPVYQVSSPTYNPNFIPPDGRGLNALLQNYWMVIHPPTLFLGFALTLIPFAYCLAGLWLKQYREWVRPALPWALVGGAILGLGILMGGYWAYETLNFGGYWNWDPVENAVYVPWLVLVASIHTMIAYKKSSSALTASIILVISTFLLILYSTFLTRSGILGNASVHSFTDLGLSGQLLIYLLAFVVLSIFLVLWRWREIPKTTQELTVYSREFWIFMGATVLCLAGFQVIFTTSIPVFRAIIESFGFVSSLSLPADQIEHYTKFQLWGAIFIALLSGTGQFFWWQKIDKTALQKALTLPIVITLLVSSIFIGWLKLQNIQFIILLTASLYTIIANLFILLNVLRKSSLKLAGGAVSHIGMGMMLIGILFSSGYSNVISKNRSGKLIFDPKNAETLEQKKRFNQENEDNLLLWFNEPVDMREYKLAYKGDYVEATGYPAYIKKSSLQATSNIRKPIATEAIVYEDKTYFKKGDTVTISPENTFYRVEYRDKVGNIFSLYPRAQVNPAMGGLLASPAISRNLGADLYTHVSSIPDPDKEKQWTKKEELTISVGDTIFINDMVAIFEDRKVLPKEEMLRFVGKGETLGQEDVGLQATIRILGKSQTYFARPIFLIRDRQAGFIPDVIHELGIKINLQKIIPESGKFTFEIFQGQRDYIVLKVVEKPLINILWIGTLVVMLGFTIAVYRRYTEFVKMRDKGLEADDDIKS